jgi:hypothetical protein
MLEDCNARCERDAAYDAAIISITVLNGSYLVPCPVNLLFPKDININ